MEVVENILRLLAAIGAGAIVGFERELNDKPAGLRTNILICFGAALFTIMSLELVEGAEVGDRSRVAAQVVTGVGFLGAGSIIQMRRDVFGLTTAATIWGVASVGIAFGAGHFLIGGVATVLISVVLYGLGSAEAGIDRWHSTERFEVTVKPEPGAIEALHEFLKQQPVRLRFFELTGNNGTPTVLFKVIGRRARINALQRSLLTAPMVISFRTS